MTESLSPEELIVAQQIGALAHAGAPVRDPNAVVRAVIGSSPRRGLMRLPLGLVALVGALLLVAIFALAPFGQMGSSPGTAHVGGITVGEMNLGGTTYVVSVARSIDLSNARLTAVGDVRHNSGLRTEGSIVYQVDEVDPRQVLVMKLVPGQHDDAGSIGDYLVLVRGNGFSLLCPYFRHGDPLAPSACG